MRVDPEFQSRISPMRSEELAHLEDHPIATVFPLLDEGGVESLSQSIKNQGLLEPILLYEGKILDGRNRYRACMAAGVEVRTADFEGTATEAIEHVWAVNRERRHLTPSQAAAAEVLREEMHNSYAPVREAAKERQREQGKRGAEGGRGKTKTPTQQTGEGKERHERETNTARAKAAGTNPEYLRAMEKIRKTHPDKFDEVRTGKKKITQVLREIRQEEARANVKPLPDGKYRVLYADPPWKYGDPLNISKDGLGESYGPADAHYPQMNIAELCALPIKDLAADDAALFLWTTVPLAEEAFKVVRAWGFDYKTEFVWDKVKHNMGHYSSVRHEKLLLCTRGSCLPDVSKKFDSVQSIERGKHSEKPEEFRQIIDTIYPQGPRIELFARREVEGWRMWGASVA